MSSHSLGCGIGLKGLESNWIPVINAVSLSSREFVGDLRKIHVPPNKVENPRRNVLQICGQAVSTEETQKQCRFANPSFNLQRYRLFSDKKRSNSVKIEAAKGTQKMKPLSVLEASQTAADSKPAATGGEVLISAIGLSKTYNGIQYLFQELDMTVSRGQKLGLLGANGTGKSTLLKVLAGLETPDKGEVQLRKGVRIGYLAQDPAINGDLTILDAVLAADTPVMNAVREYERAVAEQSQAAEKEAEEGGGGGERKQGGRKGGSRLYKAVQLAMDRMEALDGWDVAAEAEKLLELLGLGFVGRRVEELSGGQRKRVAMAATLLAKPELVILDEPTNHMDVRVIQWMERMLADPTLTVLLVSHDRYFLDSVCNGMVELDLGKAFRHSGNYTRYLANRATRLANEEAAIGRAENTLRKETEWMRKQPKARSTKSRSRIQRFYALTEKAKREASRKGLALAVGEARLGGKILSLSNARVARGDRTIFDGFSYMFDKGERVGVVGQNGVGKSTFLDAIAGLLPLQEGIRDVGETLVIGYYTQQTPQIPDDIRVLDYVKQFGEMVQLGSEDSGGFRGAANGNVETVTASSLLERFGFSKVDQYNWAGRLSGGQKRRLYLATILMKKPNFLLLDEPTNDLDLPTIEVLEDFLGTFQGCLLIASHDRAFMDNTASRLFVLEGDGQIQLFEGTYSEYMEEIRVREKEAQHEQRESQAGGKTAGKIGGKSSGKVVDVEAEVKSVAKSNGSSRKLSYMERKEYESLEKEIEKMGSEKEKLEALLIELGNSSDFDKLSKLSKKLAFIGSTIDAKTERWLELAEIAEE